MTDNAAYTAGEGQFGLAISILNRAASAYFSKELKTCGIGPGQQAYLLALQPGEQVHQDVLARRLHVDKANVTRALSALEKLGLVERDGSDSDKRVRLICLSAAGIQARAEVQLVAGRWLEQLRKSLSGQEWEILVRLLDRVAFRGSDPDGGVI